MVFFQKRCVHSMDNSLADYMNSIGYPIDDPVLKRHAEFMVRDGMSVEEAKTQRCSDCESVIDVHGTALWRESRHIIRCRTCQKRAMAHGYTDWEAKFVV